MFVAYLGPKGSFTHHVALESFEDGELRPYDSITEVMKAYESAQVEYAVIPVENSIEGSVHETIDYLFHQARFQAIAEVVYPIKQQLLAVKQDQAIEVIYSHPQALAQGKAYVQEHFPQARLEMTTSTSYAARYVSQHPELPIAAIAPLEAKDEYGLEVVARNIQEMDQNYTRFWILGQRLLKAVALRKFPVRIVWPLPYQVHCRPLCRALATFASRGLNLTKIESRPLKTVLGEYFFIIDVVDADESLFASAYQELESLGASIKTLGHYSVYVLNNNEMENV
ncbi:MAG: prephenate dehydratase [Streptococcus sp.]